jgi:predicted PurR-regulated permease PerM
VNVVPENPRDLTRTTLGVLCIGALTAGSFWILRPFLGALIWATMIVVATWPLLLGLQARLGGRRSLATAVMTIALLLLFVVPFSLVIATIAGNADTIVGWAKALPTARIPEAPAWVAGLPLAGPRIATEWNGYAAEGTMGIAQRIEPYLGIVTQWFVGQVGSVGGALLQFLLTVVVSAIMYANGEAAASAARRFGRRLAGERGDNVVRLAGQAIRGVALGVVVTALAQSVLGGIGLAVVGVPFAALLTALMFMLCLAQLGPILVLLPAVAWMYWTGSNALATVLLVWAIVVGTMDNFLRPFLIKKGADLPLLLIFAGVIGGMISLGLVGIFVGPVLLAVTYTLLDAWISDVPTEPDPTSERNG